MRYLFSLGKKEYVSIIGIRHDEAIRATQILSSCDTFEHPEFPLIGMGVSEKDVLGFWAKNDFDLQLRSYEGNCDLCFLKSKYKRIVMAERFPEKLDWWIKKETEKSNVGDGAMFRKGEPYSKIQEMVFDGPATFKKKLREQVGALKKDKRVRETDPEDFDIPCSCAEKGFGGIGEEIENPDDIDPAFL